MCKGIAIIVYLKNGDWRGLCTGISSHDRLCHDSKDEYLKYGKIEPYRFELLYPCNLTYDRSLNLHDGQGINKEQPEQRIWDVAFQTATPFFIKHSKRQLQSAYLTRAYLTRANLTDADLTDADLTDANLTRAYLTRANLTRADLTDANLTRADLTDANLTWANLTNANLTDADLTRANLTRANLTDANLTRANLTRADLTRADLTDAYLTRAKYTKNTKFPTRFDIEKAGLIKVEY